MKQIIRGNIRVQLLSNETVRIEYKHNGSFFDGDTFLIPDRAQCAGKAECTEKEETVSFGGYELYIPANAKSLAGVTLTKDGKQVYAYTNIKNSGELPALSKTPEVFALADNPRVTVPEGGYSANRKGEYTVTENVQDIYLLLCKKNAKKLRELYVCLTGRSELVRLSTLGGWNSKYYAYSEDEAKRVILDYEKHNVPLDVMVIDTDWRSCEGGWGYDINTDLFPDMQRFLSFAHEHGVEVCFNDHPEPVEKTQVFAPEEIAYREKNLQSLMEMGLDIWWYDRNWSTALITPAKDIHHETFGLYLFADITKHYWQKVASNTEVYRRPVIMGNVDDVRNGIYDKIFSSASHRYSIQWTGDIGSDADALEQEIATLNRCGANCLPYVNADCGGHVGNPDKKQFIRWMQFGTLSPVFRPHCTNSVVRWRDPWAYDTETLDIVREYNNLRYRLLPVIYKGAYESYKTGVPFCRSTGFNYPSDKKALSVTNQYMLNENILVAPVCGAAPESLSQQHHSALTHAEEQEEDVQSIYLPVGKWLDVFGGNIYNGGKRINSSCKPETMPLYVRLGSLIPLAYEAKNTKEQKWNKLVYDFYPAKDAADKGYLYEDDTETTAYKLGQFRTSDYEAYYDKKTNAYIIKLSASEGAFNGDKCFNERDITLKYHTLKNAGEVKKVTVNGVATNFEKVLKQTGVFPLSGNHACADSDTVIVKIKINVSENYEIKLFV